MSNDAKRPHLKLVYDAANPELAGTQPVGKRDAARWAYLEKRRAYMAGFRARLREARGGRTQRDMADLIGVSVATYARWETRSVRGPRQFWLIPRIWMIAGQSPEGLLEGKEA